MDEDKEAFDEWLQTEEGYFEFIKFIFEEDGEQMELSDV